MSEVTLVIIFALIVITPINIIIALYARKKEIGFTKALLFSMLGGPILGLIIMLQSPKVAETNS